MLSISLSVRFLVFFLFRQSIATQRRSLMIESESHAMVIERLSSILLLELKIE